MNSRQQPEQQVSEAINADSVEQFLRDNPDFFEIRPELFAAMNLSHPNVSGAVSLIERQVRLLREKNTTLEQKLMELVQIARENEQLSAQLHVFSNELLKVCTLSDVVAVTQDKVRELFQTDSVALRLIDTHTDDVQLSIGQDEYQTLFADLLRNNKPACGRIKQSLLDYLFHDNAGEVGSAAIIPLQALDTLGVLALASRDEHRFNPTMGHLFLSHLGDLVSSALLAHI